MSKALDGWWLGVRDSDGEVRESHGARRVVRVGETLSYAGIPVLCTAGMHACTSILGALDACPQEATVIHRVRLSGEIVAGVGSDKGKYAAQHRTVLWAVDGERLLREFACDCAERALTREREAGREPDPRSWAAVNVARRYARGTATQEELQAARAAAAAAAWATAGDAAGNAARAAAMAAAWATARAAAWAADSAAASAAAGVADSAAAGDVARTAWLAAWAAAGAASWVATTWVATTRDAARADEREWQEAHLLEMVEAAQQGGEGR